MKRGNKEIKFNRISSIVTKGIYKDSEVEITIGMEGKDCHVKINGKELTNVLGAHIHMRAGGLTKLCLELYKK